LNRIRLAALAASVLVATVFAPVRDARAAAEVHDFNLVLSVVPSSVNSGDFNDIIDQYNRIILVPRHLGSLGEIGFGWMFEAELRYFVRQNVAVDIGVGQLKTGTKREYLPLIGQSIDLRAEVITVPVHVGADYYFAPYNQGDFQARAYLGGGVLSNVFTRATVQQSEVNTTPATTLGGSFAVKGTRDSPGFYLETGVHMFFASSWSVMLGGVYRNATIKTILHQGTLVPVTDLLGQTVDLDVGGFGVRMGFAKGF
jgi:Outer membrane protein beta-barrel domain